MNRRLWIFAGALVAFGLLLGAVVSDVGRRGAFAGRYSSWSALPDGTRAAYVTLERTGVALSRRTQDLDDLAQVDALLVLGPRLRFAKHERQALVEWVDQGHTLLIMPERSTPLLEDLGVAFTRARGGPDDSILRLFLHEDEDDDEAASDGGTTAKGKGKGKGKGKDASTGTGTDAGTGTGTNAGAGPSTGEGEAAPAPRSLADAGVGGGGASASQPARGTGAPASQPKKLKDPYEEADAVPPERLLPAQPSELLAGVGEAEAIVAGTLRPTRPDVEFTPLLLGDGGRVVGAVCARKQGGRVVVVAAPDLFANRRLAARDNALLLHVLAANALAATPAPAAGKGPRPAKPAAAPAGPRRLVVDEFHHGFTGTRTVVGYIWRGDLKWVLIQLLVLGVLALLRTWRRFGPAAEPPEASQTARDYLQAMARIYRLGGHRAAAAERVWAYARRRIAARLGLSGKVGDAASAANEIEAIGLQQLARAYRRAEDARAALGTNATDGDLLAFGREVAAVEAEAQRGRGRRQKRRPEVS